MTAHRTRLKVCCIQSVEEAQLAISLGADALGLVAEMPTGPGPIPDPLIRRIAAAVPPPIATFLLTSRTAPEAVLDHILSTACNTLQLCDSVDPRTYELLRSRAPAVRIVQVIHVQDDASYDEALAAAPHVHALLLDSGRTRLPPSQASPAAPTPLLQHLPPDPPPAAFLRELGGTARTHDWSISARIVRDVRVPVFLAGGITPANVVSAISAVRPFGIDLCNGVRTAGALDAGKLRNLVSNMATVAGELR